MREEISEPQHWRTSGQRHAGRSTSWLSRGYKRGHAELAAEAVDAALAEDVTETPVNEAEICPKSVNTDIISSLASQLDLLEKQRVQLQLLLAQAQASK